MCAIVAVALVLVLGGRSIAPHVVPVVTAVHQLGAIAPVLFIGLYVIAVVALVPSSWLSVAGGAVFGLLPGFIYSVVGGVLGATAAFLLGRHVARGIVARQLESMPRLAAIDRAVSAQGRRIVFLLRLSPVAPFNFLNYALGLTTLRVRDFVIASIGMIPATAMYAYAGHIADEALELASQSTPPRQVSYYAMLVAGLAATVTATVLVTRAARRALSDV